MKTTFVILAASALLAQATLGEHLLAQAGPSSRAAHREVAVTFDLPYVRKEDISLTSTEETLSVDAKMKKPVTMKLGGSIQRHFQFEKYSKKIRLPLRVDPNNAKARFRNGRLVVSYGTGQKGNSVKIV